MINKKIPEEYNNVKNDVGLFDFSFEGKIKVKGEGRINFIDGIVSNDVKNLKENFGVYAAFLDKFGKILSDCYIYKFKEFLLITLPFSQKNRILEKLRDEAKLAKCEVEDLTLKYALFSLQGPKASLLLKDLFNEEINLKILQLINKTMNNETITKIKSNNNGEINNKIIKKNNNKTENNGKNNNKIKNIEITIIKTKRSNEDCYDLFFEGTYYKDILNLIFNEGKKYNLRKISNETYNILRLEARIPLFGIDFDEKNILPEIGEKAINYEKGCFVGQEVIARINNLGKGITAKKLMKLEINIKEEFEKNTEIYKDNEKIGFITSSAFSPEKKKVIALGFIEKEFYDNVKEVKIGSNKAKALVL